MDHELYFFKENLKKSSDNPATEKTLFIEDLDFETLKLTSIGETKLSLKKVVELSEYLEDVLRYRKGIISLIRNYHPDSPSYWRTIDKYEGEYSLSINLEDFIDSPTKNDHEDLGFYIPDNYTLSKKVMEEYAESGGDVSDFEDTSFRDLAKWSSKKKTPLKKFSDFIEEKYVKPKMQAILDSFNAESITIENGQFEFNYKK